MRMETIISPDTDTGIGTMVDLKTILAINTAKTIVITIVKITVKTIVIRMEWFKWQDLADEINF